MRIQGWAIAGLAAALVGLTGCGAPGAFTGFRTSDGITIAADLELPEVTPAPVVLLAHQLGKDRTSWDPLVPQLLDAGYAVLRIDHRGCGESTKEVASTEDLTGPQRQGFPLDMLDAIDAIRGRPGVDDSRVAIVAADFSMTPAVRCAMEHPEVHALVLLSGVIMEEEESWLLDHPEMPVLLVAASGHHHTADVERQHAQRLTGPEQRYVEFGPVDENDDARWIGTDGLRPETGLADLIVWFLQRNMPADQDGASRTAEK